MKKKAIISSVLLTLTHLLLAQYPYAPEFKIIEKSDNSITTHRLSSGTSGFQIGITSNGGGCSFIDGCLCS